MATFAGGRPVDAATSSSCLRRNPQGSVPSLRAGLQLRPARCRHGGCLLLAVCLWLLGEVYASKHGFFEDGKLFCPHACWVGATGGLASLSRSGRCSSCHVAYQGTSSCNGLPQTFFFTSSWGGSREDGCYRHRRLAPRGTTSHRMRIQRRSCHHTRKTLPICDCGGGFRVGFKSVPENGSSYCLGHVGLRWEELCKLKLALETRTWQGPLAAPRDQGRGKLPPVDSKCLCSLFSDWANYSELKRGHPLFSLLLAIYQTRL